MSNEHTINKDSNNEYVNSHKNISNRKTLYSKYTLSKDVKLCIRCNIDMRDIKYNKYCFRCREILDFLDGCTLLSQNNPRKFQFVFGNIENVYYLFEYPLMMDIRSLDY